MKLRIVFDASFNGVEPGLSNSIKKISFRHNFTEAVAQRCSVKKVFLEISGRPLQLY